MSLGLALYAPAQEMPVPANPRYVFQRVGEEVGLGTLTVTSLAQDQQGFMWLGTQTGLIRYDGHQARRFSVKDGLPSTIIDQVLITPNDRILVGTRKGVSICNKHEFIKLPLPAEAVPDPGYQFVAADESGNIYVATRKGLLHYTYDNPQSYAIVPISGEESPLSIDAVYAAPDGTIWFARGRKIGTLQPRRPGNWLNINNELPEEPVVALLKDGKGTLWVRTAKHIARYDPTKRTVELEHFNIPPANDFGMPTIDRSGNLLVPTVAGIYRHRAGTWEAVDRTRGMPVNATYSVTEDREGAYWIGLAGAGVVRWQGTSAWEAWTQAEGLPDNVIWSVRRDKRKRLWVGTNNGLAMWDQERHAWRIWNSSNGLAGSVVRDIAITENGDIWVLSYAGGITRFPGATLRPERVATPKPDPSTLVVGLDGRLWVGGRNYLKRLVTEGPPYRFEAVPVPPEAVNSTSQARVKDGVLWTGGRTGLARFDGTKWDVFTTKDGLKPDIITEIAPVSPQEVWFHYDEANGVGRLRIENGKAEVRHFTTADGMPSNQSYMVGTDKKGNVWSGGPLGLTMFPTEGKPEHFTKSDGLIWDDLDSGAFYADEDGALFFGTSGGLSRYSPARDKDRILYRPPVVITSATLGGKEHFRDSTTRVPYKENTLQVEFAALTYRDVDRVRCYYRLHGLESEVNETSLREARYPALPAGDYEFEVYCKSATGVVSTPAVFAFGVAPPWWQRWDTRTVFAGVLLLVIAGVIKIRTSSLERERLRLELAVAERNQELAKANKELQEASLTDPLTGIRNRRFFDLIITADVNQAVRAYSPPFSGVRNRDIVFYLVDVDYFKRVNDEYGHATGDKVLVEISRRICSVTRQTDVLIRWGGEEFLLISRAAERNDAMQLAARVLNAVGTDPYETNEAGETISCKCSVGWAPFPWFTEKPEAIDYEEILKLADQALYRAKNGGRNRCIGAMPSEPRATGEHLSVGETQVQWIELQGPVTSPTHK
jgi:diguanylate cyclase (GGDEF)-like protein